MAEDSATLKVRMLRTSGLGEDSQWFEYRPAFTAEIVKIEWELDTMDVELDREVAESLLRMGYAAPVPEGSPHIKAPSPKKTAPASKAKTESQEAPAEPPPSAPSWLKPGGVNKEN
jgi:hypothetical protein